MLFEKAWKNYCLIFTLWIFHIIFEKYLDSLNPSEMIYQGPPPAIVLYLPTIINVVVGAYLAVYLAVITHSNLGPKLIKTRKNLIAYGIKSCALLVIVLTDITPFLATERSFLNQAFHFVNNLSSWQEFFISGGFSILGIFLIWNLRNQKIEYEKPSR